MGMSASQARLIQLTARMSDLELEGQQINQQRLNIANQSSALSEQALKMPVPTAPSPYDYQITSYTGKIGSGANAQTFSLAEMPDGNFQYQMPSTGKTLESSGVTVPIEKAYNYNEVSINSLGLQTGRTIKNVSFKREVATTVTDTAECYTKGNKTLTVGDYNALQNDSTKTADEKSGWTHNAAVTHTEYSLEDRYTPMGDVGVGTAIADTYTNYKKDGQPVNIIYHWAEQDEQCEGNATKLRNAVNNGYSDTAIASIVGKYYTSADGKSFVSTTDFTNGILKEGVKLYSREEVLKTSDGEQFYTLAQFGTKHPTRSLTDIKERIRNFEIEANRGKYMSEDAIFKNWRFAPSGETGVKAVKVSTEQDGKINANVFSNVDEGDILSTETISRNQIDFGASGPQKITLPDGRKITLTMSTGKDEDAYQAAYNEYENAKAEYDLAQERFNQETKKLQNIDKQLELKLKRLDTERNALNTEIDSVKKVLQDNIEKSTKTFSG